MLTVLASLATLFLVVTGVFPNATYFVAGMTFGSALYDYLRSRKKR